jgi:integrase
VSALRQYPKALSTSRADREYVGKDEARERRLEDGQDADLYRVAAFTGLRLGELRTLRWGDMQFAQRRLIVHRAFSANVEGPTKSWQARYPPLSDGAADALDGLSHRGRYIQADDYVFCSRLGRPLDGAALRRRFHRVTDAAGLRTLRFHALGMEPARSLPARLIHDGSRAFWDIQSFRRRSGTCTPKRVQRTSTD